MGFVKSTAEKGEMSAKLSIDWAELEAQSRESRALLVGVAPRLQLSQEEERRLHAWQEEGYFGEMEYLNRGARERVDVHSLQPWAKALLTFAFPYTGGSSFRGGEVLPSGYGRVARYAWGRDYHRVIKRRLNELQKRLFQQSNVSFQWRPITDSYPILERAFARESGFGFIGKNTMLIRPGEGSYFFLAEVLTDLEVTGFTLESAPPGECGSCSRCQTDCPTGAFQSAYQLDARRCISYLTIEKRGSFSEWEREAIGEWIFGCDICQEVCPFNHRRGSPALREFRPDAGSGGQLSLEEVLSITSENEFRARFAGTPLLRPGRVCLLRNAICVSVNRNDYGVTPRLFQILEEEREAILREHSVWALRRLLEKSGEGGRLGRVCDRLLPKERDTATREEMERALD